MAETQDLIDRAVLIVDELEAAAGLSVAEGYP
jgi:hypothetical protein